MSVYIIILYTSLYSLNIHTNTTTTIFAQILKLLEKSNNFYTCLWETDLFKVS